MADDRRGLDGDAAVASPPVTLLTNHATVLVCLREHPSMRIRDVAAHVGLAERTVKTIIEDLVQDGYLTRVRVGRRNAYEVNDGAALRGAATDSVTVDALFAALQDLGSLDYQDVVDSIVDALVDLVADSAQLSLLDEATGEIVSCAMRDRVARDERAIGTALVRHSPPVDSGFAKVLLQERRPILVPNFDEVALEGVPPDLRDAVRRHGKQSMIAVPLVARGHAIGTLGAGRNGHPFTEDDLALLERFAARAAAAIVEARDRRADLAAEAHGTVFALSWHGVLVVTPDGRVLAANPAACELLAGTAAELRARTLWHLLDREAVAAARSADRGTDAPDEETVVRVRRLDGTPFPARVRYREFTTTGGEPRACLVISATRR